MYIFLYVFTIALAFLIPEMAQASNMFDPATGSKAIPILDALFGKLSGGGVDAFSSSIAMFNGGVLIIAGLLAAYTILAGTLGTAHDGEMLGKKFSSVWIPIRYSVFTALMLPIIGGGYCAMQAIVYWLIVQGVGLADKTWAAYVGAQNITQAVSAGITRPSTKQFTYKLLETLSCQSVISKTFTKDGGSAKMLDGGSEFGMTTEKGKLNTVYSWGDKNEKGQFSKESCGSISVKNFSTPAVQTSNANLLFNVNDALGRMVNINREHQNQVAVLITQLQPLADGIAEGKMPSIQAIDDLADRYEEAVRLKAAEEIQQMDAFKNLAKNAQTDGFITAGSFFIPISYMADMVQRSVADVPTATGPGSMNVSIAQDQWEPVQISLQKLYQLNGEMITSRTTFGSDNQAGKNTGWWKTLGETVMTGDLTKTLDKAFASTADFMIVDGENAVLSLKRMGTWLLTIASTAYIALTALTVTVGNATGFGFAFTTAIMMFITPIIVTGFLLSYVFPFVPFLIWVGAITGYFLLVVEAILAAPLWAMVHLSPKGDDLVGSGSQGYKLVLSLLLRPVLMVFGLIAALTMTQIFGNLLNQLFAGVFIMSQSDSGLLIKVFGYLVAAPIMYGAMMYSFMNKMFSIITHLPDNLLGWISSGAPELGKFADDMGGERSNTFLAAAAVTRSVGSDANSQKQGLSGGMKESGDKQSGFKASLNDAMNKEAKSSGDSGGFGQQKVDAQMSNISETLGGEGSENMESFEKSFQSNMEANPEAPVMQNMNTSFHRELNHNFGRGTGDNLKDVSGGTYAGSEFKQAVASYKQAQSKLDGAGVEPRSIRSMIGDANVAARDEYRGDKSSIRNGGDKNLNSYLENHLSKLGEESTDTFTSK